MIKIILISFVLALTSSTLIIASPPILGAWVIILALIISIYFAFTASWVGLIVFLIYVGGLLVIFAYFVALTPNIIVSDNSATLLILINLFLLTLVFALYPQFPLNTFTPCLQLPLQSLLLERMGIILSLAIVLFLSLVAVVKICTRASAPLRPFN